MAKFQVYKDAKGEHRWRLRADNGKQIAESGEGYKSKAGAQRGIELVKKNALSSQVEGESGGTDKPEQSSSEHKSEVTPGWYPNNVAVLQYWDGELWTDTPQTPVVKKSRVAAIVIAVATFLVGIFIGIASAGGGGRVDPGPTPTQAESPQAAASPSPSPLPSPSLSPSPSPSPSPIPPPAPSPQPSPPRATAAPRPPAPPPQAPAPSCHPSYSGVCLKPDSEDYDCAGGSGNGPDYTTAKNFQVVGPDEYGLDSDHDGIACES